jgi:hypothetical protein
VPETTKSAFPSNSGLLIILTETYHLERQDKIKKRFKQIKKLVDVGSIYADHVAISGGLW